MPTSDTQPGPSTVQISRRRCDAYCLLTAAAILLAGLGCYFATRERRFIWMGTLVPLALVALWAGLRRLVPTSGVPAATIGRTPGVPQALTFLAAWAVVSIAVVAVTFYAPAAGPGDSRPAWVSVAVGVELAVAFVVLLVGARALERRYRFGRRQGGGAETPSPRAV